MGLFSRNFCGSRARSSSIFAIICSWPCFKSAVSSFIIVVSALMSLVRMLGGVNSTVGGNPPSFYIQKTYKDIVSRVRANMPLYPHNSLCKLLTSFFPSNAHLAGPSGVECFSSAALILSRVRLQSEVMDPTWAAKGSGIDAALLSSISLLTHSRICVNVDNSWLTPKRSPRAWRHILTKSTTALVVKAIVFRSDVIFEGIDRGSLISTVLK